MREALYSDWIHLHSLHVLEVKCEKSNNMNCVTTTSSSFSYLCSVGCVYFNDCPAQPSIPTIMVISGFISFFWALSWRKKGCRIFCYCIISVLYLIWFIGKFEVIFSFLTVKVAVLIHSLHSSKYPTWFVIWWGKIERPREISHEFLPCICWKRNPVSSG